MNDDSILTWILILLGVITWIAQKIRQPRRRKVAPEEEPFPRDIMMEPTEGDTSAPMMEAEAIGEMMEDTAEEAMGPDAMLHDDDVSGAASKPQRAATPAAEPVATPDLARGADAFQETPVPSETRKPRTVAGIPITPRGMRQGIIISEVLGKPKSRRGR